MDGCWGQWQGPSSTLLSGGDSSTDSDPSQAGASPLGTSMCDLAARCSCKRRGLSLWEVPLHTQGWGAEGSPDPPRPEEGRAPIIFCNRSTCGLVPLPGLLPVLPVRTEEEGEDGLGGFIPSLALCPGPSCMSEDVVKDVTPLVSARYGLDEL